MKRLLLLLPLILFIYQGCDTKVSPKKIATIVGKVVTQDNDNNFKALDSVYVKAEDYYTQTLTDAAGNFTLEIELPEKEMELTVTLRFLKEGYTENSRSVKVKGGETVDLAGDNIILLPINTGGGISNAIIEGRVVESVNGSILPLENVTITFTGNESEPTFTDVDGLFSYSYELRDGITEREVSATFEKSGYERKIIQNIQIQSDLTTRLGDVLMISSDTTTSAAFEPYAIQVESIERNHIYVTQNGLPEITAITVKVTDVRGDVIDDNHRVIVDFEIVSGPNGGETIYPSQVETSQGMATAYLQSGIRAGEVQVRAKFTREDGYEAKIEPVRIVIWGGFPVQRNFSLGIQKHNIAGLVWLGLEDRFTAYMGDRWNNPVAPGTAVYFTSEYCYIEGSAYSDELGRATATFLTAAQYPTVTPATWQEAFVTVYASTNGQPDSITGNPVDISGSSDVLLTAAVAPITYQQIRPTDQFFVYDSTHTIFEFTYDVADIYGNPLVANTNINVNSDIGSVSGAQNVQLLDITSRGPGSTQFSFSWSAPAPDEVQWGKDCTITIQVRSPANGNGRAETYIVIRYQQ